MVSALQYGPHYRAFRCDAWHASFWEQNGHRVGPTPRGIGREWR